MAEHLVTEGCLVMEPFGCVLSALGGNLVM